MNSSPSESPFGAFLAELLNRYCDPSALEDSDSDGSLDLSPALSEHSLDMLCISPAQLLMPQVDTHSLGFADQGQDDVQGPMLPTEMTAMGIYADPNIVPYAATQAEAPWTESIFPMPAVSTPTLFPSYDPTSSSLFGALGEAPCLPSSSQDAMSLAGNLPELELHSFGVVTPVTAQVSPYPADASFPSTPELQYYSSSSSPSTPSSCSESSDSSDYVPSPRTKRASRPKNAKSAARRNAKPYARTSPTSSAPPSPSGSTSSCTNSDASAVRIASIKYTARRVRTDTSGAARGSQTGTEGKGPWDCPHCDGWTPTNRSKSDLKRHIKTHFLQELQCLGERIDLLEPDELTDAIARYGAPWEHEGRLYVGGCQRAMSRTEVLVRHLRNPNINCIVPFHLLDKVFDDEGKKKGKGRATRAAPRTARKARK